MIEACWSPNPIKRPSFDDIVIQLKSNKVFFEVIEKDDYLKYVKFIDEYHSTFDETSRVLELGDFIDTNNGTFHEVSINLKKNKHHKKNDEKTGDKSRSNKKKHHQHHKNHQHEDKK